MYSWWVVIFLLEPNVIDSTAIMAISPVPNVYLKEHVVLRRVSDIRCIVGWTSATHHINSELRKTSTNVQDAWPHRIERSTVFKECRHWPPYCRYPDNRRSTIFISLLRYIYGKLSRFGKRHIWIECRRPGQDLEAISFSTRVPIAIDIWFMRSRSSSRSWRCQRSLMSCCSPSVSIESMKPIDSHTQWSFDWFSKNESSSIRFFPERWWINGIQWSRVIQVRCHSSIPFSTASNTHIRFIVILVCLPSSTNGRLPNFVHSLYTLLFLCSSDYTSMCQAVFQRYTHFTSRSSSFIFELCAIFPSDLKSLKWEYLFKNTWLHSPRCITHARSYFPSMRCIICKNK